MYLDSSFLLHSTTQLLDLQSPGTVTVCAISNCALSRSLTSVPVSVSVTISVSVTTPASPSLIDQRIPAQKKLSLLRRIATRARSVTPGLIITKMKDTDDAMANNPHNPRDVLAALFTQHHLGDPPRSDIQKGL